MAKIEGIRIRNYRSLKDITLGKLWNTQQAEQPYLVDALQPKEVWVLEKGKDDFSTIRRASENPVVEGMVAEGLPLGGLWHSDYLDK